jgi:hypothetical protein
MYQILNGAEDLDNLRCHPLAFTQRHRLNDGGKVSGHACKDTNLMSANTGISHSQMLDSLERQRRVKQDVVEQAIAEMRIDRFATPPQDSFLTQCADEPTC